MPRPSNTDERRREIAAALGRLLPQYGYQRASIQRIADEAGLTAGLVHYHFKNKKEILTELVGELAATLRERFATRVDAADSPLSQIDAFIDAHLAFGEDSDEDAVATWVAVAGEALVQDEIRPLYERFIRTSRDVLTDLARGALRAHDVSADASAGGEAASAERAAEHIAATLLSGVHGAFQLGVAVPDSLPAGFAAPALKETARALIRAAAEGRWPAADGSDPGSADEGGAEGDSS